MDVKLIRQYMRKMAPDAQEVFYRGIPGYKGNRMLAVISPTKKDIAFVFSRGAEFEDKCALLQGVGKLTQHLKFRSVDEARKEVIGYYIKQGFDLDSK